MVAVLLASDAAEAWAIVAGWLAFVVSGWARAPLTRSVGFAANYEPVSGPPRKTVGPTGA